MNYLSFGWTGPGLLAAELSRPLKQISIEFVINRPRFITLWRSDGTGLRLYTDMHDVAERREVGVLNVNRVSTPQPDEVLATVPPAFESEIIVFKLLIRESGVEAESGVVFTTQAGDEIVVVAGAYPYSLAVQGVSSLPHVFEPEYPLDQYLRVPIA